MAEPQVIEPTGKVSVSEFQKMLATKRTKPCLAIMPARQHGALVDLGGKHIDLTGAKTILGCDFINGQLRIKATGIHYWYVDHQWPNFSEITSEYDVPRHLYISGQHAGIHGSDFHNGNGSPLTWTLNIRDSIVEGTRVYDIWEHPGTDPKDYSHLDSVAMLKGGNGVEFRYTTLEGRNNIQAFDADIDLVFDHVWSTKAPGAAFQFNSRNGKRIRGRRTQVTSFAHGGNKPTDRVDFIDGKTVKLDANLDRINVVGVPSLTAPPPGTTPPEQQWRSAHPRDTWKAYLYDLFV